MSNHKLYENEINDDLSTLSNHKLYENEINDDMIGGELGHVEWS